MTTHSTAVRRVLLTTALVCTVGVLSCGGAPDGDEPGQDAPAAAQSVTPASPEIQSPIGTLTVTGVEVAQPASAQEAPQIHTPIGVFTITSVALADRFPAGCTWIPGVTTNCHRARGGLGLLVIQISNPDADVDVDFTDSIEDDMKAVEVVGDDGRKWELGLRQWTGGGGIHFVFTGEGSPSTVVLTWPGNRPIPLQTGVAGGGVRVETAPVAAPEAVRNPVVPPDPHVGEVKGILVSKETGRPLQVIPDLFRDAAEGEDQEAIQAMLDAMESKPDSAGAFHWIGVPAGLYHLFTRHHGIIGEGFVVVGGGTVDLGVVEVGTP